MTAATQIHEYKRVLLDDGRWALTHRAERLDWLAGRYATEISYGCGCIRTRFLVGGKVVAFRDDQLGVQNAADIERWLLLQIAITENPRPGSTSERDLEVRAYQALISDNQAPVGQNGAEWRVGGAG